MTQSNVRNAWQWASTLTSACAVAAVSLIASPPDAFACGGFFCSSGPVDQHGEDILFEVDEDGQTSVVVEVQYNGDPGAFSWVVPVPEVPTVDVVPSLTMAILRQQTQLAVTPPPMDFSRCEEDYGDYWAASAGGLGCSDQEMQASVSEPMPEPSAEPEGQPAVDVTELPRVGPYDNIVTVFSDESEALIEWLNANGYIITDAMKPMVREYVGEGWGFLAVQLAPDAGVQDIAPLKFTCPGGMPRIPLRLTGVAAEPQMDIRVYIAGDERFRPLNYRGFAMPTNELRYDLDTWDTNLDAVLSQKVAEAGGRAFVTERAQASALLRQQIGDVNAVNDDEEAAQAYLVNLFSRASQITKMRTRMDGRDMVDDPIFVPGEVADYDGTIDLSRRPVIDVCAAYGAEVTDEDDPEFGAPASLPDAMKCVNNFCGANAICTLDADGNEGCHCITGFVGRNTTRRVGGVWGYNQSFITCQDVNEDMLADADIADPCDGFTCGEFGTCVALNGFATCTCDAGYASFVSNNQPNGIECRAIAETFDGDHVLYTRDDVLEPAAVQTLLPSAGGCAALDTPTFVELLGLGVFAFALRRTRRRRD